MSQFGNTACQKCDSMQSIVRANEEMIQQQIKLIKGLQLDRQKLENAHNAVLGKLGELQSQLLALREARSSMISITIQTQTPLLESKCRNSSSSLDEVSPTKQLLNKIQKGTNLKNSTNKINKENVGDFLKVSKVKEEQKASRVRKYSMGDQVSSKEWIKKMQNMKSVTSAEFKQKTLHLLKRGIPHQLRRVIWPVVVQNQLAISDELYQQLAKRREWIPEQVRSQIRKDIQRSFSGRTQYYSREGLRQQVCQILQIFHLYRPDVSYIQGMTYPVIILTLTVGKNNAFTIFSNLILANPFFRRLFTFEKYFPQCIAKTFEILLAQANEDIATNLKDKNIDPQTFLVEWFFTIFSRSLSYEATLRFWDNLLYLGQITLFRLSVAILQLVGPRVIDTSYEQTIGLIQGFGGFGKQHKLLDSVMQNKIPAQKVYRIMQKCYKELELLGLKK